MLSGHRSRISATQGTRNFFASFSPAATTNGEGEDARIISGGGWRGCIDFRDLHKVAIKEEKTAGVISSAVIVRVRANKDALGSARKGAFEEERIAFVDEFSRIVIEVGTENDRLIATLNEVFDNPIVMPSFIKDYARTMLMNEPKFLFHVKPEWVNMRIMRECGQDTRKIAGRRVPNRVVRYCCRIKLDDFSCSIRRGRSWTRREKSSGLS